MRTINSIERKNSYQGLSFYDKRRKKLGFSVNAILYAFCIFPFFEISALWSFTGNIIHYGWAMLGIVILLVCLYRNEKSFYLDNFNLCFFGYAFTILFSAYLNHSFSLGMVYSFVAIWILIQAIHYCTHDMLEALALVSSVVIAANVFSMFFFHEKVFITAGMPIWERYAGIVGGRNSFVTTILPMGYIVLFYCLRKAKEDRYIKNCGYAFWALAMLSIVLARSSEGQIEFFSATGIVIVGIGVTMCIVRRKFQFSNVFLFVTVLCVSAVLIGFHNEILNSQVATSLFKMLQRGNDLSQRTYIWDGAMEYVKQSLFLGNGRGNNFLVPIRTKILEYGETHNALLQVLYNGGIVATVFYIGAFVNAIKKSISTDENKKVVYIAIFCLWVGGVTESNQDNLLLWILLGIMNETKLD